MKTTLQFIANRLSDLAHEDRGAEGLEKLLIVAAIVLPLLGILLYFKNAISSWVNSSWGEVTNRAGNESDTGNFTPPSSN